MAAGRCLKSGVYLYSICDGAYLFMRGARNYAHTYILYITRCKKRWRRVETAGVWAEIHGKGKKERHARLRKATEGCEGLEKAF